MNPGEIYMADFPPNDFRPVIIISREELNRGRAVLGVLCTSAKFATRRNLPNCVPFNAGQFGFTADCVAQGENLLTFDKQLLDLDGGPMGVLDEIHMRAVIKAIAHVIEADCEPL